MSFEEGDRVVLRDEHSEYDGAVGTVSQVMATMFGDETYSVQFEDGQETGLPPGSLESAPEAAEESPDDEDVES